MTKLSLFDELAFQHWYKNLPTVKQNLINPDPDNPLHFYDYRKAWLSGAMPDENGHLPSQFKLEAHPRMFLNGMDTSDPLSVRLKGALDYLTGRDKFNQ